jgi:hypothetical protein
MKFPALTAFAVTTIFLNTATAQQIAVRERITHPPEMDQLRLLEIQYDGQSFSLVPPYGCRWETDSRNALIKFMPISGSTTVMLRWLTNSGPSLAKSSQDIRDLALSHLPSGANVSEVFQVVSSAGIGRAVDATYRLHDYSMQTRAAVIPLKRGCAVITATSPSVETAKAQQSFGMLLTSFQSTGQP